MGEIPRFRAKLTEFAPEKVERAFLRESGRRALFGGDLGIGCDLGEAVAHPVIPADLVILVVATAHPQYSESTLGACMITAAALLPVWLWMTGKAFGFPLFPLFSATHIPTHALPLLYEHPIVSLFPANNQLIANAGASDIIKAMSSTGEKDVWNVNVGQILSGMGKNGAVSKILLFADTAGQKGKSDPYLLRSVGNARRRSTSNARAAPPAIRVLA